MKVFIGPYIDIDKDGPDAERQVEVEIHDYDTYSLDHTLARIIYPALLKFRDDIKSYPMVEDEDVPDMEPWGDVVVGDVHRLIPKNSGQDGEEEGYKRWLNVLDQILFSFYCIYTDNAWIDEYIRRMAPHEEYEIMEEKIQNGLKLFGKYYRSLWS